jgi:hypothetical protein
LTWASDQCPCDRLQALLEQRAIVELQQPLGDVDALIGVDPNQMVVEGGMVDLGKGDAVGDDRLTERLMGVGHDVGGVEEVIIRQVADGAAMVVGGEHAVPEGRLVQPLLDQGEGIAALDRVWCRGRGNRPCELAERDACGQAPRVPVDDEGQMMAWYRPGETPRK